jgi:prolyl-tRNA synthetase
MKTSGANEASKNKSSNEYILNSTHEEIVTPIGMEHIKSYRDLPAAYYQIQTKFRNEARAKSGLLRGREFRMKDLYSFHKDEKDLLEYYENVKNVYMDIYKELRLDEDTFISGASGGDFTKEFSHEFQTIVPAGEDEIYVDKENRRAYNKEIVTPENAEKLGVDFSKMEIHPGCEVGNIFPLNTKFSESLNFKYKDENGDAKYVYMGCYGFGPSRTMGVIVEKYGDEKGLVWPKNIAPYEIEIVSLHKEEHDKVYDTAERIYTDIEETFETLWDDRLLSPGNKLADADLYGCPVQIIIGEKSLAEGVVEIKQRKTGETVKIETNLVLNYLNHIWPNVF